MMSASLLRELADRLVGALPPGMEELHQDARHNLRHAFEGVLSSMNVVTREEFDVQSALLVRSRERLEELEKRVAVLEAEALKKDPAG